MARERKFQVSVMLDAVVLGKADRRAAERGLARSEYIRALIMADGESEACLGEDVERRPADGRRVA